MSQSQASNGVDVDVDVDSTYVEEIELEEITREQALDKEDSNSKKRKAPTGNRSEIWKHYSIVMVDVGNPPQKLRKGKCNVCGALIKADSKTNGTSGLRVHYESCKKKHESTTNQTQLNLQPGPDGKGELTCWKVDQAKCRMKLVEMIILDELPFRFVERIGFKLFMLTVCPNFKLPSRQTVREDCLRLFLERRLSLKIFFQKKDMGRVSITSDCWTAVNNTSYICVTGW